MKKTVLTTILTSILSLSANSVFSAGNGDSPKGKPFVAINDQIVVVEGAVSTLQEQIDLLVEKVDTVEQRVVANEVAIGTLQDQNIALETLIYSNASDIASIEVEITSLVQTNADLVTLIAANTGDVAMLQAEVDANQSMITSLQAAIVLVNANIITLGDSLQAQIDNNLNLIAALQVEVGQIQDGLLLKQNLVNGICPDGSAVVEVLPDGAVVCHAFGGGSGQLSGVSVLHHSPSIAPNAPASRVQGCPAGYNITSGGYATTGRWNVSRSYSINRNTSQRYFFFGTNLNTYSVSVMIEATCLRIEP